MKIAHTADWHLGKTVNGFSMLKDQEYTLNKMLDSIKDHEVDAIIMAGDLYDRSNPRKEVVALADKLFTRIKQNLNIPLLLISGNHDSPERIEYGRRFFEKEDLYFEALLKDEIKRVRIKEADFWMIPFSDHIVGRHFYQNDKIRNFEELLSYQIESIEKRMDSSQVNILIYHGFVISGGLDSVQASSSERSLSVGTAELVSAEIFNSFDYVALGHLHRRQNVKDSRIRYSGSPLKYSKSEVHHIKGYDIIDIKKDSIKISKMTTKVRHDMKIIKGLFRDLLKEKSSDYVFIELEDEDYQLQAMQQLRQNYPRIMGLEYVSRKERSLKNDSLRKDNVRKKSLAEMFGNFYYEVRGKTLSKEQKKIIMDLEKGLIDENH